MSNDFLRLIFEFPTVLFTFALGVVLLYWLFTVVTGNMDFDMGDVDLDVDVDVDVDVDADGDADSGLLASLLTSLGLAGIPLSITFSLLILFAWFLCLVGAVLVDSLDGVSAIVALFGVLVVALVGAVIATRILVTPLRRILVPGHAQARRDFVGRVCVIRTMDVTDRYGQAEVTSDDGSTAVIQVRSETPGTLVAGVAAVIHTYDVDGEFFWVSAADPLISSD